MSIVANRPMRRTDKVSQSDTVPLPRISTTKSPKGKAAKAARAAEQASWWNEPVSTPRIPAQVSLTDANKIDDRKPALPVQAGSSPCPMCWVRPGVEHELSCDTVSPKLAAAYIDYLSRDAKPALWPTNVQLGQTVQELVDAGRDAELPALARSCGVTEAELTACQVDYICHTTGAGRMVRTAEQVKAERAAIVRRVGQVANDPTWCERNHGNEEISFDGRAIGAFHERRVARLVSDDPMSTTGSATAAVYVESCDDEQGRPAADSPPRVVLTLGDGSYGEDFPVHGSVGVQGWSAPVEHVRALAAALLAACDLIAPPVAK